MITVVSRDLDLQEYTQKETSSLAAQFHMVDWDNFGMAMKYLPSVYQTNVIKLVHDWVYDGHQQDLFPNLEALRAYLAGCGNIETHQHNISLFDPPMIHH